MIQLVLKLSFILLIFSCNENKRIDNGGIIVSSSLNRAFDSIYSNINSLKEKSFDITLSIINKTSNPASFWIMKCSWQDNFIIEKKGVDFNLTDCDGNFPTVKTIKSQDSLVFKTTISGRLESHKNEMNSLRFGFVYIDTTECNSFEKYLHIMSIKGTQKNIVWSNPIFINPD